MPTYTLHAVNVGSFPLGESDKVLTLFSSERGIVRAVAKGARKPGSKIGGRADVLNCNRFLLATGRSLEIITQSESIETFPSLRKDLTRLSYGLYYAELSAIFGQGLEQESEVYYEFLREALRAQNTGSRDAAVLCLEFEFKLLEWLGYQPEIVYCVVCREPLTEYLVDLFNFELGGIVCNRCVAAERLLTVAERSIGQPKTAAHSKGEAVHITPLVWKRLVLASHADSNMESGDLSAQLFHRSNQAARRIMQGYIEYRAGKKMKALDLIAKI